MSSRSAAAHSLTVNRASSYRWLTQVYVSVQPTSGAGKLVWHALGAKTIELIHQNVHVDSVRDDLETLVVDAELLEAVMGSPDPTKRAKEFESKLTARLRKHMGNPRFKKLSERLEALKDRHERGLLNSVEFLKQLLELARELVATEKETPPEEDVDRGKAALTELFQQVKNPSTPVVVERILSVLPQVDPVTAADEASRGVLAAQIESAVTETLTIAADQAPF